MMIIIIDIRILKIYILFNTTSNISLIFDLNILINNSDVIVTLTEWNSSKFQLRCVKVKSWSYYSTTKNLI